MRVHGCRLVPVTTSGYRRSGCCVAPTPVNAQLPGDSQFDTGRENRTLRGLRSDLDPAGEQQHDDDDQDDTEDTDSGMAETITVASETAAEAAEQEDDENYD